MTARPQILNSSDGHWFFKSRAAGFWCGPANKPLMEALLDRLARAGVPMSPAVRAAFLSVDVGEYTDYELAAFFEDLPLVFLETRAGGVKTISAPHMIATMLHHLELAPGQEVCILGAKGGYIAALIAEIVGPTGGVVLVDPNREVIKHVRACLAHDTIRVRKMARLDHAPPHLPEPLHRVLVTGSVPHLPAWLARRMSEGGFALAPIGGRLHQRLEKLEKVGDAFESTDLGGVIFGPVDIADTEPEPFSPASLAELMQEAAALGEEMDVLSNEDVQRLQGLAGVLVNLHEEPDLPTLGEPEEGDGVPWVFDVDRHEDHPVLDVLLAEIDWLAPLWPTLLALVDVRIMRPGVDDEGGGGVFGRHTDLEP